MAKEKAKVEAPKFKRLPLAEDYQEVGLKFEVAEKSKEKSPEAEPVETE